LKASLLVNDNIIPLNDFTQSYIANILSAIVRSLGTESENVTVLIDSDKLHIYTEKGELDIKRDFARQLIGNTIKGMLSPMRGVLWLQNIRITAVNSQETPSQSLFGEKP
jgi:hypothetical protein